MTEHHHNMRIEELPHDPEVEAREVDNAHGNAIALRLSALIVLVPAMVLALVTLGNGAGGGANAVLPILLLATAAIMLRRAREVDPDDRL